MNFFFYFSIANEFSPEMRTTYLNYEIFYAKYDNHFSIKRKFNGNISIYLFNIYQFNGIRFFFWNYDLHTVQFVSDFFFSGIFDILLFFMFQIIDLDQNNCVQMFQIPTFHLLKNI